MCASISSSQIARRLRWSGWAPNSKSIRGSFDSQRLLRLHCTHLVISTQQKYAVYSAITEDNVWTRWKWGTIRERQGSDAKAECMAYSNGAISTDWAPRLILMLVDWITAIEPLLVVKFRFPYKRRSINVSQFLHGMRHAFHSCEISWKQFELVDLPSDLEVRVLSFPKKSGTNSSTSDWPARKPNQQSGIWMQATAGAFSDYASMRIFLIKQWKWEGDENEKKEDQGKQKDDEEEEEDGKKRRRKRGREQCCVRRSFSLIQCTGTVYRTGYCSM